MSGGDDRVDKVRANVGIIITDLSALRISQLHHRKQAATSASDHGIVNQLINFYF